MSKVIVITVILISLNCIMVVYIWSSTGCIRRMSTWKDSNIWEHYGDKGHKQKHMISTAKLKHLVLSPLCSIQLLPLALLLRICSCCSDRVWLGQSPALLFIRETPEKVQFCGHLNWASEVFYNFYLTWPYYLASRTSSHSNSPDKIIICGMSMAHFHLRAPKIIPLNESPITLILCLWLSTFMTILDVARP